MTITNSQANQLFNRQIIDLLVQDYESGKALQELTTRDSDNYFEKSLDDKAEEITKFILSHSKSTLRQVVKNSLQDTIYFPENM